MIFSTTLSQTLPNLRRNQTDIKTHKGFHIKFLLLSSDFNETWIFRKICEYKISCISVSGSQIIPCGQKSRLTWWSWQSMLAILRKRLNWIKIQGNVFSYKKLALFNVTPCSNDEKYPNFGSFLCNHDIFIHFYAEDIGSASLFCTWPMAPSLRRR